MKGSIIALIGALVIGGAGGFMVGKKATSGTEDELVGDVGLLAERMHQHFPIHPLHP